MASRPVQPSPRHEDRLGRLSPGYLADLIVLDTDPFTVEPHELQFIRPVRTMVAGDWVYRKDENAR
jgi:predicted amidohydrolase YtcJ